MKTLRFKYALLALLLIPLVLLGHDGKLKGKYNKEKTINKEFAVDATALLKVSNKYGNVTVTSWDENRVVMEIKIKVSGNNEDKVDKRLQEIDVEFDSRSDMVSAKTVLSKGKGWNWNWGKNNLSVQINYSIKAPVKNSVHLNNDYGAIILDRIDGHAKINCDYGRLEIGELRGRNNQLTFDYTSKSVIDYMNSGSINADYSGFTLSKVGNLTLNADYTNANIGEMKNLEYSSDYGSMGVESVENVDGNGDYISVDLGTVHGNVDISADYGSIKIAKLASDAGNVNISTDYTGIKIGYDPAYNFDFEISTEYASVKGKDDFEIMISKEKNSERYYKGYYGREGSGNSVYISSEYGGVSFYKN